MVMEFESARWTDNGPQPFRTAPGGGLAATRWTSTVPTPFGPAPGGGRLGGMFESGFAAEAAVPVGPNPGIVMDPIKIIGKGPFTVKREPVQSGQIPSMVVRMRYTDRGSLTQGTLDAQVKALLKRANFKVSIASSFKPLDVTWRYEHDATDDFYFPVIQTPTALLGMRYSGNAARLPVYSADPNTLAKMPNQIWVYTMAITSGDNTMSDGEAAQALTLLKQAMVNMANTHSYANVELTLRGCPPALFEAPVKPPLPAPIKASASALLLLVAYNMLSPHIGSEIL